MRSLPPSLSLAGGVLQTKWNLAHLQETVELQSNTQLQAIASFICCRLGSGHLMMPVPDGGALELGLGRTQWTQLVLKPKGCTQISAFRHVTLLVN